MSFLFRWKHQDGSIVEFSEKGWRADDPEKEAWLIKMSAPGSPSPVLTIAMKIWLQTNCQLVESRGLDEAHILTSVPGKRCKERVRPETVAKNSSDRVSRPWDEKRGSVRRGGRKTVITQRSIQLACDEFFRSHGMSRGGFNR
jgi:hypothetical protein